MHGMRTGSRVRIQRSSGSASQLPPPGPTGTLTPPVLRVGAPRNHCRFCGDRAMCRYFCPQSSTSIGGVKCAIGWYRADGDAVDTCTPCDSGTVTIGNYCPAGTPSDRGLPCPKGTYNDGDVTACAPCSVSTIGNYCPAGSSDVGGVPCPAGQYSGISGPVADCKMCTVAAGSVCPQGSISAFGTQCDYGKYSAATGNATECLVCPAGTYADERGRKVRCEGSVQGTVMRSQARRLACGRAFGLCTREG